MVQSPEPRSQQVNPFINFRSIWKNEEDVFLFQKVEEVGKKWSKISSLLGTRSEHSVKNRYHHVLNIKCKAIGENYRNLSKKKEMELIKEYKVELEKEIGTEVKLEENIQPIEDCSKSEKQKQEEVIVKE